MADDQSELPSLRHATMDDVPTVLALIKALASYENELSSVEATEASLRSTLSFALPSSGSSQLSSSQTLSLMPSFSPGHARTLLVSAPDGTVAGIALYFFNYSTWKGAPGVYLEDLFVQPQYRKRGYGRLLFERLAQVVKDVGGSRLEWSVLKWNQPGFDFYHTLGAKRMDDWVGMRLEGDALTRLASGKTPN